ncbi:hypothetical protein ACW7EJ_07295, partial [Acinetobacter soli]
ILQDQSSKLLPKERVLNCLKRRIDKSKNREVKYNEIRKKAHWSNVQRIDITIEKIIKSRQHVYMTTR